MAALQNAESIGAKVIGAYVDPPGHALFMIVDAGSVESLHTLLDPFLEYWNSEVRPVADFGATLARLIEQASGS